MGSVSLVNMEVSLMVAADLMGSLVLDAVGHGMTHTEGTKLLRKQFEIDLIPFKGDGLPMQEVTKDVLKEKYLKGGEATELDLFHRVAESLASVEDASVQDGYLRKFWQNEFLENMKRGAIGAGRIMSAAGTGVNSAMLNCFVQPVGDCIQGFDDKGRPGIYEALREAAETMRRGGGVGYDFSGIRPKGAWVKGTDSVASGPCSYINVFDQSCSTVESAGSRRGAQMGVLRIDHPDVLEFIEAKRTKGRWNNFNVSVGVTDAFMEAVKRDGLWDLVHECPKTKEDALRKEAGEVKRYVYETVKARELWDKIMRSAYDYAEPGILFLDNINRDNNLNQVEDIGTTNPCVTADTWVMTGEGARRVGELVGVPFEALVDGVRYPLESNGFFSTGVKEVLRVSTKEGFSLRLTSDHFVLVKKVSESGVGEDSWVRAGDLNAGDSVVLHNHRGYEPDSWSVGTGSFTEGFSLGRSLELYKVPSFIESEGSGFLIGFLQGLFARHGVSLLCGEADSGECQYQFSLSFGSGLEREFLCGVQRILQRFGVHSELDVLGNGDICSLDISDLPSILALQKKIDGLGYHASPSVAFLSENWEKWADINTPNWRNIRHTATVESVCPDGTEEVYDVTVSTVHAFDANGMYVHNCGEQPLPNYGCCDLGPLILPRFVRGSFTKESVFDYKSFAYAVWVQVRALDNVLDATYWALPQQREEAFAKRRVGVGFTGLGDALVMLGYGYDADDGREFAASLTRLMRDVAYRASVSLAIEKGKFPVFDSVDYVDSVMGSFATRLPESLKGLIRMYGIRNSHLLSIAPTGTVSLAFADNASNGVEPAFSWTYQRKKREADGGTRMYDVEDHAYRIWRGISGGTFKDSDFPKSFKSALEIDVSGHLGMLAAVQPYIDTSISKTVNIPADYPFDKFKDLYLDAFGLGLKGLATYRPNLILGSVLSVKEEEPKKEVASESLVSSVKGDAMREVVEKRPKGILPSITEKVEYFTLEGSQVIYLTVSFMPLGDGRFRALEFFMPAGQARESQQWITSSMRLLSLAARGGFLDVALGDMRKVTWDRGAVRLGVYEKGDGTKVPMWHDSEVAAIAYAIQKIIENQKSVWSGDVASSPTESGNVPLDSSVAVGGKKCTNCGAWAVVKRDGCNVCLACNEVGSCG